MRGDGTFVLSTFVVRNAQSYCETFTHYTVLLKVIVRCDFVVERERVF